MSTKPSVGYDSFQRDKQWAKVSLLNGADILNTDFNEAQDICRYRDFLTIANSVGLNTRIASGFRIVESSSNTNNFDVLGGTAISYGSIVFTEGDFTVDSGARAFSYNAAAPNYYNYLFVGKVSAAEALTKRIIDDDKTFTLDHNLSACRVLMLTGNEIGNSFTIQGSYGAGWGGNSFILDTFGTFGITAGDQYVILPPALVTPSFPDGFSTRTDEVYLQTWYEEINDNEDSDIKPPTAISAQSYRDQLRWCVRVAEGYYDAYNNAMVSGSIPTASDSDNPFGVHYIPLATLSRANDEARIFTSHIANYRGVELPLGPLSQEVKDTRTSDWLGTYTSEAERLTGLENTVKNSKLFNGSFELGTAINSDIPGWIPSSTSWGITTGASNQAKCVAVDHTTRSTVRGETLTSYPFYVRPNQPLRFYALSKGVTTGTIYAELKLFSEGFSWDATPVTTKTLAFGVGTTGWTALEDTFTAPSSTQWGYVQLRTASQTGTVYFDDVRVEYLEEAMNNTGVAIPSVELMACSFNEGIRGWNVNQQYAQNENVTTLVDTVPCVKLTNGGTNTTTRIYSWPISTSTCNFFDDTIIVSVKAKYSDINYGILTGPQVGISFYDSAFNEVTTPNEPVSLAVLDWGSSISSNSNPGGSSYNTYTCQFTAPVNASFFTISLGLLATSGSVTFQSLNVRRFGSSVNILSNRTWHDICANGEFGRGYIDSSVTSDNLNDPPQDMFDVIGWDITDESTQCVHWKKNSPTISASSGDRVIEFNIPANTTTADLLLTQIVNRTITKQDFTHGFVLDFDYMYSNPAVKTELWIDFLDSNKESVVAKTVIDLIDAANLTSLSWTNKVIGIAPPSTTTTYGSNTSNSPVYLSVSFRVSQTASSASSSVFRVAGVKLWSRTIQTSTNLISDEQFVAMDGYYVHDAVGHTKDAAFYKNSQKIVPSSTNKFLLENDGDLMRYTRPHATRHYPVLDDSITDIEDAIPYATALQTGLLNKTDWSKFDQALQREDMEGILQAGIKKGLYVDEYATVYPGVALDKSGRRLEVTVKTQLTIPTYNDPQTTNIIYIWWNEALAADNKTELKIISSTDTESGNPYAISPMDNLLPDTAIILALGKFDKDQYALEYADLSTEDKLLYRKHFVGIGYAETPVPPSVTPTYTSYEIWRAPAEYLINAEFVGITETLRTVDLVVDGTESIIPTAWEPKYKIIDTRLAAYRRLEIRDDDLILVYMIEPHAYSPISEADYSSLPFAEFGSGIDTGWGDGQPLSGAFTHWPTFLAMFGDIFGTEHYEPDQAYPGKHKAITVRPTGVNQLTAYKTGTDTITFRMTDQRTTWYNPTSGVAGTNISAGTISIVDPDYNAVFRVDDVGAIETTSSITAVNPVSAAAGAVVSPGGSLGAYIELNAATNSSKLTVSNGSDGSFIDGKNTSGDSVFIVTPAQLTIKNADGTTAVALNNTGTITTALPHTLTKIIPASSAQACYTVPVGPGYGTTPVLFELVVNGSSHWNMCTVANGTIVYPLNIPVGCIITGITATTNSLSAAVNYGLYLKRQLFTTQVTSFLDSTSFTSTGAGWETFNLGDLNRTLEDTYSYFVVLTCNTAGNGVGDIKVTYTKTDFMP